MSKQFWEPLDVSTILGEASAAPDKFLELYDNDEYDSSISEVNYFSIYNDCLLWHLAEFEESEENWKGI